MTIEKQVSQLQMDFSLLVDALSNIMGVDIHADIEKSKKVIKEEVNGIFNLTKKPNNQLRRELIQEAKELVNDLVVDNEHRFVYSFKVDEDKRTVRLVRLEVEFDNFGEPIYTGKVLKKVAVADEEDVFNADIGKAILIGSMHGIDISKFTDAVQPDKVVTGMKILSNECYTVNGEFVFVGDKLTVSEYTPRNSKECQINSIVSNTGTILDDTYAIYYKEFN